MSRLRKNTGLPSSGRNCFGMALFIRFPFPPANSTTPTFANSISSVAEENKRVCVGVSDAFKEKAYACMNEMRRKKTEIFHMTPTDSEHN